MIEYSFSITNFCYILPNSIAKSLEEEALNFRVLMDCSNQKKIEKARRSNIVKYVKKNILVI